MKKIAFLFLVFFSLSSCNNDKISQTPASSIHGRYFYTYTLDENSDRIVDNEIGLITFLNETNDEVIFILELPDMMEIKSIENLKLIGEVDNVQFKQSILCELTAADEWDRQNINVEISGFLKKHVITRTSPVKFFDCNIILKFDLDSNKYIISIDDFLTSN